MAITRHVDNVRIGAGRLYVDLLDAAGKTLGERDLGDSIGMSIRVEETRQMVYSGDGPTARKLLDVVTQRTYSATVQLHDMSDANAALWLGGDATTEADNAAAVTDEEIQVRPGLEYQLGTSASKPMGYLSISASATFSVTYGATAAAATTAAVKGTDYEVDEANARLKILAGGSIAAGNWIKVDYTPVAATHGRAATPRATKDIRAAVRYVEDGFGSAGSRGRNVYVRDASVGASDELALKDNRQSEQRITLTLGINEPASGSALTIDGVALAA